MESNNNTEYQRKPLKRKKRSFMQQVNKRFKKSESFPKGKMFEKTEHEYFLRVLQLENIFEGTLEDKEIFANNALAQTENREVDCSSNQMISRVVEKLLPLASNEVLEKYFEAFGVNLRPICVHDFASHVLQSLMIIAAKHSLDKTADLDSKHVAKCNLWLLKVSKFLLNNIEEFMWNKYANHLLRTAMFCLAGIPQMDKHNQAENHINKQTEHSSLEKSKEFIEVLGEFFSRVTNWTQSQFKDFLDDSLSSGFLEALLSALKPTNSKKYKILCKKILTECFPTSSDEKSSAMSSPIALRLLELIIEQSEGKLQKKIYDSLLSKRLLEMSMATAGNFTIQKIVNKCDNPEMLVEIVTTLAPDFKKILDSNKQFVITSLCQACERLKVAQSEFFQGLTKALNYDGLDNKEQLVPAILALAPLPHTTPLQNTKHGSLLVQSLLKFQKPIKLVNSLLAFEKKDLVDLLCSPHGNFITGAFCQSEFVGEKSRQKLIKKLMGHYPYLAQSKFGSRSFDDIWEVADVKVKLQITQDLVSGFSQVTKTRCGQFIASKVGLEVFRTQGIEKWKQQIQSAQTKKKLFAPIISDVK